MPKSEAPAPVEPERSRWWVPVLVIGLILAAIAVVLWLFASDILGNGEETSPSPGLVVVPNVVDMKLKDAEVALEEAGLVVADDLVRVEDPEIEPSTVVAQDPAADEQVEEGAEVTLTIVKAPGPVAVPDVAGATATGARLVLEQAGFLVEETTEASTEVNEGFVIRTEPPAFSEAEYGSTVTMVVSSGAGNILVPEVRCLSFNAAQNKLEKAGLNGVISSTAVALNPACPLGNKVAAQDPSPGTELAPGGIVTLFPGEETTPTGPTGPTSGTGPTA